MNMDRNDTQKAIESGKTALGVELGSTRIKAVLIGEDHKPIASGSHEWENRYKNGVWTYSLDDVWKGLQDSFRNLSKDISEKYGVPLKTIGAMGFSAMMHGYLAFDQDGNLLVPFRTWRNTMTAQAAEKLTDLFQFNIPQRWSVAHLYQAILNQEPHITEINHLTTLAGYVHWKLTGQKVLGVGEASGMFPIDSQTNNYDERMLQLFNERSEVEKLPWKLQDILPKVLVSGEAAGVLTTEGAKLLDPTGQLQAGIPLCPPEGDAGTGMVATNSVAVRTGNVSAGTSVFAMIVLEKALSKLYPEIDMVTTPTGKPVAMVHSNNCTSDLNAWVDLFQEIHAGAWCRSERSQTI
jgi:sugar (pentulose or hexulose) kinase